MIRMRKERVFQSPFHRQGNRSPGRVRLPKHSKESQPAPHRPSTLIHMAAWLRHRAHRISHAFCTWQDWMRWTTEQEGEGGHSFSVKVSIYFVEHGVGGRGFLGILTGKREYMGMQAFLPFLQGSACEFPVAGVQASLLLQDHTAAAAGAPSGASVAHISCKHQLVSVRV